MFVDRKPLTGTYSRRNFIRHCGLLSGFAFPFTLNIENNFKMKDKTFDVIIIGGSYAGLSAAMALGRALRNVLVIDGGKPANRFTPHSHNFITHDGRVPGEIAALAKQQVLQYSSVKFINDFATKAQQKDDRFVVSVAAEEYTARKIILATGIIDQMPAIPGFEACWGKSVLHCPYCHGYEVRNATTGILGDGDYAFEFASLIFNWTKDLKVYTNGASTLSAEQRAKLNRHNISIVESRIKQILHTNGSVRSLVLEDGGEHSIEALYSRPSFSQHSDISDQLGCELTSEGYLRIDQLQQTTTPGVFACGDNITRMRTVANAVSLGTSAGMIVNKILAQEDFD